MEKEALLNAIFGETLNKLEEQVNQKAEEIETSLNARIEGIRAIATEGLNNIEAIVDKKPLTVNLGTIEKPKNKIVHSAFKKILKILSSAKRKEKNIMMVGEAGSGKTHLASCLADALKVKFYPMSVGLQTTKSDLLGFVNATGNYVTSLVREAYEKGGVLLLDEFDAAHAGVVTILNSLLANGHCSFPDKIVDKNENFICICACNTYGRGGNIDYIGRNRLDGATLDRFIVVDVGYDKKLEKILTKNEEWYKVIEKIRENVNKQGIKMIVSPRASMDGADLLEAGFKIKEVLDMIILKGCDETTKKQILQDVDLSVFNPKKGEEPKEPKEPKPTIYDIEIEYDYFNAITKTTINNKKIEEYFEKEENIEFYINKDTSSINMKKDFSVYVTKHTLYANPEKTKLEDMYGTEGEAKLKELMQSEITKIEDVSIPELQNTELNIRVNVQFSNKETGSIYFTYSPKPEQLELEF